MAYDANVLHRATARLEENKRRREDQREQLRQQLYAREPRLAKLDRQLQGTMAQLVAASLRKGEDAGAAVRAIRDKNLDIQQERAVLLGAMGLPEDALDPKPACPLCNDTGWRGAQMCQCLKGAVHPGADPGAVQAAGPGGAVLRHLPDGLLQHQLLARMGHLPPGEHGAGVRGVSQLCPEVRPLLLQKPLPQRGPGLGKTFLSACIARTVSENGHSVVYDTAGNVFAQFEARKFLRDSDDGREARDETRRYLGCDLLILDEWLIRRCPRRNPTICWRL